METEQIQYGVEKVETRTLRCRFQNFLEDLVGIEPVMGESHHIPDPVFLDAEIQLNGPRLKEPNERYGYEVRVSVDYGDDTKVTFAAKNESDLWFYEREMLRGAFPDNTVTVNLDFYIGKIQTTDRYNVPTVFGKVVKQAIDDLIEKASTKIDS